MMKLGYKVFIFGLLVLAGLSLEGCGSGKCPTMSPGSTGGTASGTSGGVSTPTVCPPIGGGGTATAFAFVLGAGNVQAVGLSTTGTLAPLSPFTPPTVTGTGADDMLIVNKAFLYIPQAASATVEGFTVNSSTGALTAISGSPFPVPSGADSIASDPKGRFLFVGNEANGAIATFQINATTGALTASPASPFTAFGVFSADVLTVDGNGKFLYVGQMSSSFPVHGFNIDQTTGAISEITGSPFSLGIATPHADPSGKFLLGIAGFVDQGAASGNNNIFVFNIDPTTGAPSPVTGSPFATSNSPEDFAISPNGQFIYTVGLTSSATPAPVEGFQMNTTTGALSALTGSPFTSLPTPVQCKFEQSGAEMFCADSLAGSKVIVLTTSSSTGAVTHTVTDLSLSNAFSFPFAPTD